MSPAKIAQATIVTIAARAGMGSIQKVTGTNRATDIVAVRPGMAPMNTPYVAERTMTSQISGAKTTCSIA
jgi:hypothetical protein